MILNEWSIFTLDPIMQVDLPVGTRWYVVVIRDYFGVVSGWVRPVTNAEDEDR